MRENTFTHLFDEVREHTGLVAAVYGVAWRYGQMADHACYAGLETIARQAGVDRHTVIRYLAALTAQGWIIDLTPGSRNVHHVYQVTDRLAQSTDAAATSRVDVPAATESHPTVTASPPAVTTSHSAVTESQSGVTQCQPAVTASHLRP